MAFRLPMKKKVVREGQFERSNKTKKIHVSKVQLGMYIAKLDRDWLETPFLMQGFLVESLDDIDLLAELCEFVWIDAVFEEWTNPVERAISGEGASAYTVRYINKLPPQEEHRAAIGIYKGARTKTKSMLDELRLGGVVNTEQAKSTVNECVESVIRNPDALSWMSKVRSQDEHTAEHCLNVCILAISFGRHMGMDNQELRHLGLCGLLHDVGKMRIEPTLLTKRGNLSERDEKILKAHAIYGRNLLMASPGVYNGAIDVAYSHHERVDGLGYPRGIKSAGISHFTKMISIVDAYDDMTANRNYAESITCTEALKTIYRNRGTQFDERLALEFIKAVGLYPAGTLVELKNGLVGIVLETNKKHHHLPRVIVLLNAKKEKLDKERVLNLEKIHEGTLSKKFLIQTVHRDGTFDLFLKDYKDKGLTLTQ